MAGWARRPEGLTRLFFEKYSFALQKSGVNGALPSGGRVFGMGQDCGRVGTGDQIPSKRGEAELSADCADFADLRSRQRRGTAAGGTFGVDGVIATLRLGVSALISPAFRSRAGEPEGEKDINAESQRRGDAERAGYADAGREKGRGVGFEKRRGRIIHRLKGFRRFLTGHADVVGVPGDGYQPALLGERRPKTVTATWQ